MTKIFLSLLFVVFSFSTSHARELPEVIAYGSDHGASPANSLCFVANSRFTPYQGGWLIPFTCLGGEDLSNQLWFVKNKKSQLLQESTQGHLLSKAYSDGEKIAWTEFDESGTYKLLTATMNEQGEIISQEYKMPAGWKSTYLNSLAFIENSKIWFGMTSAGEDALSVSGEGHFENGNFFRSPFKGRSYFFTAESSTQLVVQKTRSGKQPGDTAEEQADQIEVRLAPDFVPQVVLRDRDGDPQSKVLGIWNSGAIQGDRWAFIATIAQGTGRAPALIRGQGLESEIFPLDKFFKSVDAFNPAILNDGRIVLRGTSIQGQYGLWIFDGSGIELLATKGDKVVNYNGDSLMMTEKPFVTSPASSGKDVVIGVSLADPATGEVLEQDVVRWEIIK